MLNLNKAVFTTLQAVLSLKH